MKKTKIICTLGPSASTKDGIMEMVHGGMNVARINMSHTSKETFLQYMKTVASINRELQFPVPVLFDTQGTDIRLKKLEKPISVLKGEHIELRTNGTPNTKFKNIGININIFKGLKKGMKLYIDDGTIELETERIHDNWGLFKVTTSGVIKSRKAVNIPNLQMDLGGITPQDYKDIKFAIEHGADIITLSFVRHKREVVKIKKLAKKMKSYIFIIAKIEDATGLKNIDDIIDAADGIMIARGDLGAEIPLEEVPLAQKDIINKCSSAGKPVIVATQMMESMIENPVPTRAEVSDIAQAVGQKADLVMLSAETSVGEYPVRCVKTMSKICERIENEGEFVVPFYGRQNDNIKDEITFTASLLASDLGAKAILVFTKSGELARLTSKHRPTAPIFAFTQYKDVQHSLALSRGVNAYLTKIVRGAHKNMNSAISQLKKDGFVKKNDMIVIISDVFKGHEDSQIIELKKV